MNLQKRIRQVAATVIVFLAAAASSYSQEQWVASWTSSQQLVEPQNAIPADQLEDVTLRQVIHLTVGGSQLRLHVSNRYDTAALQISSIHLARAVAPASSKIVPDSDQPVTFSGHQQVTIPANAEYVSDPIAYPMAPLSDLTITMHLQLVPAQQTGHPGSRATSYLAHGDRVSAAELADAKQIDHWYFLSEVDVSSTEPAMAIIALGDSITDGHGATLNGNDRWPDVLAKRLQSTHQGRNMAVLNQGIGGNRLLLDSLGPKALSRFNDDVLAIPGARYLLVLEGINDIGMFGRAGEHSAAQHEELVNQITGAYQQIVSRAHAHGIKVIGCTLLPFGGSSFYQPVPAVEGDREAVNRWIRSPGHFDEVIDFDELMRDPVSPDHLLPKFDSGDHLHPSPSGYTAMADAISLALFTTARTQSTQGVSTIVPAQHP